MPKFVLKSGKESFQIQQEADETYEDFQAKVFAMTDIPPKNLKVLYKGKMIKDKDALMTIPSNAQIKIMGTKSGNELKKTDQIATQQIMIEEPQKVKRYGFVNIGNTCYMNASFQFLRSVPQINQLMKTLPKSQTSIIPAFLADLFKRVEKGEVQPVEFVQIFLTIHAQFQPFKSQHDADQFMQTILDEVRRSGPNQAKALRQTFEIELVETIKTDQIQQQPQVKISTSQKIGCSLGGMDKDKKVGTIVQGIRLGLQTKIEKISTVDNLSHIYNSTTRFNNLPPFLIVQMIRFFWKEVNDPDTRFNKPVATKICKPVDFSAKLDVFQFCTDELKEKLVKGREIYEQNKKKEEDLFKIEYEEYKKSQKDSHRPEARVLEEFKEKKKAEYKPLTEGLETGMYEIHAVVTHLGNSVESGHYMAWVKQNKDEWMKFDDDLVYDQPQEKVFQLRGGQPNLQIAYLFMFRKVYAKEL